MEGAEVAVLVAAVVVVDAVGGVGVLLDLADEDARADGVDGARGNEEHVPPLHGHAVEDVGEAALLDGGLVGLAGGILLEAVVESRALLAVQNVPHFGLAVLPLMLQGILVGGVYLHRQVALGVDELDEEREVIILLAGRAQGFLAQSGDIIGEGQTRIVTRGDNALPVLVSGQLPALGQGSHVGVLVEFGLEPLPAPEVVLEGGGKLDGEEIAHGWFPFMDVSCP